MILVNGHILKPTMFPDKTSQIWHLPIECEGGHASFTWIFENEAELFHLAQARILFDTADLTMNYLPYARQDKAPSNDACFALGVFADLINGLNFELVRAFDPHSEAPQALINNFKPIWPQDAVAKAAQRSESDIFCFPDAGALKKYTQVLQNLPYPHIYGAKIRDQATGFITDYQLSGECKDRKVLIVDDICDGGATFVILAKILKERGAKQVALYVSHGLFSKGVQVLKDAGIDRIFTQKGEIK